MSEPNKRHIIQTTDGEEFDIPVDGSLGLLALGDIGLLAWREKIAEVKREMATRSEAARQARDSASTDASEGKIPDDA